MYEISKIQWRGHATGIKTRDNKMRIGDALTTNVYVTLKRLGDVSDGAKVN